MLNTLRNNARRFQNHLTRLDNQPLNKAALVVLIFLDLFILSSIFNGLADHTRQLTSPDEYIPALCRDIVIDSDWNPTNRLNNLAKIVSKHHASYYPPDTRQDNTRQHAICSPIAQAYLKIRDDEGLARNLKETLKIRQEIRELRSDLDRTKGAYDTTLLESITNKKQAKIDVYSIRKDIDNKTSALDTLAGKEQSLVASIEQNQHVIRLFTLAEGISDADQKFLRDELRQLNFWYPVKRLGMQMAFLLPLLFVFYFWNSKSIANNRHFQTLVSSHLLVVAAIPVFLKIAELIYDIVPRRLLRQIIELLESLKIIAIWHYLVIGVAILAALALIYLFQKKLFSREKLMQRRIANNLCQDCGQHLPADSRYCPVCGSAQYRTCSKCNELTHIYGKHCKACGSVEQA